jgi:hypothetical protein
MLGEALVCSERLDEDDSTGASGGPIILGESAAAIAIASMPSIANGSMLNLRAAATYFPARHRTRCAAHGRCTRRGGGLN